MDMGGGGGGTTTKDNRGVGGKLGGGGGHIITCKCLNSTLIGLKLNIHPGINPCPSENSDWKKKRREMLLLFCPCCVLPYKKKGGWG